MAGSSSSPRGTRPTRARSLAASAPLSDLDRRILDLLSFLRVLTQTQLASLLSPEIPPRTLRYRTARLAKLGLIGRTRPYRERGSAPHHLWPTRKGEAIAEGGPPPRGGERREPREGWRQRNPYCPPLLFITTSAKRARSFLATCRRTVDRNQMLVAATPLVRDIGRSLVAREWLAGEREGADLLAILRGARRPYDEVLKQEEEKRREEDAERERLRSDPTALREHLRSWRHRDWGIQRLGADTAKALEITVERDEELAEAERRALLALGEMFADPLRLQLAEDEPSTGRQSIFDELVEHQRARQLEEIEELAERFAEGPALRKARGRIEVGELPAVADLCRLRLAAEDDGRSLREQEQLRSAYLSSREERALYRWKSQRLFTRLHSGPEDFLEGIDRRSLRLCLSCEEVAYPDPERPSYERGPRDVAYRCHFCGSQKLAEWEPSAAGKGRL